ncbi:MAG: mannitol dehydrogenase family protein [Actinomycetota bacterium]|nr:mannitol dehydrogenase family protein [Actinomycetota bacterium]
MHDIDLPWPRAGLPLSEKTLLVHSSRVPGPTYDRAALEPGVVHIGVGGFHRAHQAVYLDEVAERGLSVEWGVVGVGLRSRGMTTALSAQDGLFTVVERGGGEERARIVGALGRCLFAPDAPDQVFAALTDPRTRLVTLTVTGAGYPIDEAGEFDPSDPDVLADLVDPSSPSTVFGYLTEALDRRRRAELGGFTVLSCDNIVNNGAVTRTAVTSFARNRSHELASWITDNVTFPSSMVDRITPSTSNADRGTLARTFGVADRWPVVTEPYRQWVVEDDFCNGRPPLEEVGVEIVDDVTPYKLVKSRLLNGSHSALGYLGHLAGHRRTDTAMTDRLLRRYIERLMADEVAPLLPAVPGLNLAAYQRTLLDRFANPTVGDPLARLCQRGSTKVPAYLLPSLREALAQGRPAELLTLAVAGWFRYLRAVDLDGKPITVEDARADRLQALAWAGGDDPRPLLAVREVFGDLGDAPGFVTALQRMLGLINRHGLRFTLHTFLHPTAVHAT